MLGEPSLPASPISDDYHFHSVQRKASADGEKRSFLTVGCKRLLARIGRERMPRIIGNLSMADHYPISVQIVVSGFLRFAIRVQPSKVLAEIPKIRKCTIRR